MPRKPNLGPFFVDVYEYPPTFLTLPRLMGLVAPDFCAFRRLWFALNLAIVVAGLVAIAWRLDAALGTHAVWLTPLVLAAPPMIATLQMGNVQLVLIAAAVAAMLLFERRWYVAGGLLLAYVMVSKLFPGVLVVYLLLRRDWRAVGLDRCVGVALAAASLALFGMAPLADFLDHLPKLLSGEAFPAFRARPPLRSTSRFRAWSSSSSCSACPHGFRCDADRRLGLHGRRRRRDGVAGAAAAPRGREPLLWLVVLILATLRSPFLPTYAAFPTFWLATLDRGGLLAAAGCALAGHPCGACSPSLRPGRPAAAGHRRLDVRPHGRRLRAGRDGDPLQPRRGA